MEQQLQSSKGSRNGNRCLHTTVGKDRSSWQTSTGAEDCGDAGASHRAGGMQTGRRKPAALLLWPRPQTVLLGAGLALSGFSQLETRRLSLQVSPSTSPWPTSPQGHNLGWGSSMAVGTLMTLNLDWKPLPVFQWGVGSCRVFWGEKDSMEDT